MFFFAATGNLLISAITCFIFLDVFASCSNRYFTYSAYPIDGILQVEEEEEENQSDNETYTIENDVRQRRKARTMTKSRNTEDSIQKRKRSFPRPGHQTDTNSFNKWSRKGRKIKQEVTFLSHLWYAEIALCPSCIINYCFESNLITYDIQSYSTKNVF